MFRTKKKKSEITVIFNRCKNTFDEVINSSDTKFSDWPDSSTQLKSLDWPEQINKGLYNTSRSGNSSLTLSKENCWNNNIPTTL